MFDSLNIRSYALAAWLIITAMATTEAQETHDSLPQYGVINLEQAALVMLDTQVIIVDVRTPEEVAEGHLEGAINVDFRAENFFEQVDLLDRDQTYLLYCRSGRRSASALELMQANGFSKLYDLEGGFLAWKEKVNKKE